MPSEIKLGTTWRALSNTAPAERVVVTAVGTEVIGFRHLVKDRPERANGMDIDRFRQTFREVKV